MKIFHALGAALDAFRGKSIVTTGGFELLARLTSGSKLTPTQLLERYGKSMYVFACVNKIAEKVASIPLGLEKVLNSKGDVREIDVHPLLDLLYKPNAFQTKSEFWKLTIINLKCSGEAFLYKVRNKGGRVMEMWNLRPDLMTVVTDPTLFVKEYRLRKNDGSQVVFDPDDIVHIKSPDPLNPYGGISPLFASAARVETEGFATTFQKDFFLNSARPDAILKSPNKMDKDTADATVRRWEKRHRGKNRSGKVGILTGGMEYMVISPTQKDMDYIEGLKLTRDDILIAFGVPKSVLGITEDVNRANAETGMGIFLSETVKPCLVEIVEKLNEEMTYQDFGDDLEIVFDDPTPANRELMLEEHTRLVSGNVMLINEARAERGLPPVKGGWSLYMSIANTPVGGLPQGVKIGGDTKADAYIGEAKPKRFNFRGKGMLKMKLEMREETERALKAMKDEASGAISKGIVEMKGNRSMIADDAKEAYAGFVLKAIDHNSERMKTNVEGFFKEQKGRVLDRLGSEKDVKVSAKKLLPKSEVKSTIKFITPEILAILKQAGEDAVDTVSPAQNFEITPSVKRFLEKRAQEFAESATGTTLEKLSRTLSEGIDAGEGIVALRERVEDVYAEFPLYRAELIARTETTAANNAGFVEGWKQSDVVNGKEWITAGDGRVRDEHVELDGEIVPVDKNFSNGLPYPSEPNCRCVLAPAFIEE
ncbi:MAG: phage portal protein [Candidatus Omnitrophota bacterium]